MKDEITELRLYSPLTADLFEPDSGERAWEDEGYDPDEPIELDGYDLVPYQEVILDGIADEVLPDADGNAVKPFAHFLHRRTQRNDLFVHFSGAVEVGHKAPRFLKRIKH